MFSMRTWCAATAAVLAVSCGSGADAPEELGGVKLVVSGAFVGAPQPGGAGLSRSALSTATATSVVLYATPLFEGGRSFAQPLTLNPATGKYEGEILHMKVGSYDLRADATAADGSVVFTGGRVVTIQRKVISLVALMLQQVPAPDTQNVTAPRIVALTLSTAAPYFGETITISVSAVSGSPGATLLYSWDAVCAGDPGAMSEFSPPDAATTQFTTSCTDTAVVTAHVHEGDSLRSAVTTRIRYTTQGADALVTLNSWPDITRIGSTSAQAPASIAPLPDGVIPVFASAEDDDGDALSCAWSSSCGGFFDAGDTLAATFHTPAVPDGGCTLTLTVQDGRGGTTSGTVQVWIATPTVINEVLYDTLANDIPPYVDASFFVELWGVPGQPLDGFTLVGVNGSGGGDYNAIDLTGYAIGPDGFFVVAHPQDTAALTGVADLLATQVDYQNSPDSLQLRRQGVVVDAVAYGTFSSANVIAGEGRPAPRGDPGTSLTRDAAHTDTGDNLSDFTVAAVPTPRAP